MMMLDIEICGYTKPRHLHQHVDAAQPIFSSSHGSTQIINQEIDLSICVFSSAKNSFFIFLHFPSFYFFSLSFFFGWAGCQGRGMLPFPSSQVKHHYNWQRWGKASLQVKIYIGETIGRHQLCFDGYVAKRGLDINKVNIVSKQNTSVRLKK